MEAIFIYILKTSGLITLFYLAYYFLLRKETFFNSNRWFLLSGLITSIVLPFVVYTKIICVAPTPTNFAAPVNTTIKTIPVEESWLDTHLNLCLIILYVSIITVLLLKFAFDFYSLKRVIKGKTVQNQADFKFVDVSENIAPFSFFSYIVYNSSLYNTSELENILEHEKIHSEQNHTTDVLMARIFCIAFWFNPIVWLYKKAIMQNLEFIADAEALKRITDKKAYQYTLLKITTHENCVAITNHFYQSLIKKRIVMLNKNQSKKKNYWKYALVLPLLGAFVFFFQVKLIAQEKDQKEVKETTSMNTKSDPKDVSVYKIKKNTTDKELNEIVQKLKTNHEVIIAFSAITRNSANELTGIRVDIRRKNGKSQIMQTSGNEAIKPFGVIIIKNQDGTETINLQTGEKTHQPVTMSEGPDGADDYYNDENLPIPPTPPTPPSFPEGAMPVANVDMSKMPKPPVHPKDVNDEKAMKKFNKEMAEFNKKMEAFEPDMSAYEKEVEAVMAKREAIFEKEMAKFNIDMEKFNQEMEKFNQDMKKHEIDMKKHEKEMKAFEKENKSK
ncbi:M56 family metallopeptidase [Flavobacterium hydatis]|uniref:Peptidase M56 n=1 Tax=Flavobacterium hydatis TaxID=991 RepID=A0A086AIV0_FLAHY|nr:M56 family metallopeptidase [Flavobacterium hydatis]KFF16614.1 peptidase M56 [Flavobacterium hydatis]OXA90274.1 peptidase M56 [Flavobacterium hydatis]